MAATLLEDNVSGYFAWLAGQCVSEPLKLAKVHYHVAVELAAYRTRAAQHEARVKEAAHAASAVLELLDDTEQFLIAADELSTRLAQLIDARPVFPRAALTPMIARARACVDGCLPEEPSTEELQAARVLLKTSPPDEPMSAANWLWLRGVCPSF